jgi:hypothetical protein
MKELWFNLQLFAEGEAAPAPVQDVQDTTAPAGAEANSTTQPSQESQGEQNARMLVTDPQTRRKRIVSTTEMQAENKPNETPSQDNEPASPPNGDTKPGTTAEGLINTQPYTLDEINEAIRNGTVDERRIGPEFQQQYLEYRQKQAQKAEQQRIQQQKWQEEQQKAAMAQQRQFLEAIDAEAKKRAMQEIGITPEELNTAEYSDDEQQKAKAEQYKSAVEWNRLQMLNAVQQQSVQQQQAQQQQRALYQSIVDFARQKQQTEPHFNEINQLLATHYQNMPYKEAQTVAQAIESMNKGNVTEAQCKVLEKYYDDTRSFYYAKENDLSKQPKRIPIPKVEQPGTGATTPQKPIDFTQMRSMNVRQRREFLANLAHGNK